MRIGMNTVHFYISAQPFCILFTNAGFAVRELGESALIQALSSLEHGCDTWIPAQWDLEIFFLNPHTIVNRNVNLKLCIFVS